MKTMPDYFKEAGYSTALIGKWHLGHEFLSMTPNARGYDYFFGNLGKLKSSVIIYMFELTLRWCYRRSV